MTKHLILIVWVILLAAAAAAQDNLVGVKEVTYNWTPASGPVIEYAVYVARNNVWGTAPAQVVEMPRVTIPGDYGDKIKIRVAARDTLGNQGEFSPDSVPVYLVEPAPEDPVLFPVFLMIELGNIDELCAEKGLTTHKLMHWIKAGRVAALCSNQ